jgi:hypothetical protein
MLDGSTLTKQHSGGVCKAVKAEVHIAFSLAQNKSMLPKELQRVWL